MAAGAYATKRGGAEVDILSYPTFHPENLYTAPPYLFSRSLSLSLTLSLSHIHTHPRTLILILTHNHRALFHPPLTLALHYQTRFSSQ